MNRAGTSTLTHRCPLLQMRPSSSRCRHHLPRSCSITAWGSITKVHPSLHHHQLWSKPPVSLPTRCGASPPLTSHHRTFLQHIQAIPPPKAVQHFPTQHSMSLRTGQPPLDVSVTRQQQQQLHGTHRLSLLWLDLKAWANPAWPGCWSTACSMTTLSWPSW